MFLLRTAHSRFLADTVLCPIVTSKTLCQLRTAHLRFLADTILCPIVTSKTLFVSAGNSVFKIPRRHNTLSDGDIKDFVCLLRKAHARFLLDTIHSPKVTSKPLSVSVENSAC